MTLVKSTFEYERIREIGRGFFGTVYVIRDRQLNGQFATKEIPNNKFRPGGFDEIFAEAQGMHASACAHVMPIRSAGQNADGITFVMPYLQGKSVADKIATDPLSLRDLMRLGQDILIGLAHIHRSGIVHFDLKPSNVLYGDQGQGVIADFGQMSRVAADGLAIASAGTYQYITPPETLATMKGSVLTDIYQTGMLLYRAVNGEAFYGAQVAKYPLSDIPSLWRAIHRGNFPDRKSYQPHVPDALRRVINKAMNIKADKRFQTANEFSLALGRVPIPINWTMRAASADKIEWSGSRPKNTDMRVTCFERSGQHSIDVHTVSSNGTRRKNPTNWCAQRLGKDAATAHLERVFREIS